LPLFALESSPWDDIDKSPSKFPELVYFEESFCLIEEMPELILDTPVLSLD